MRARRQKKRPELTLAQRIQFLELFSKMASNATYERCLDLEPDDVEYYRQTLDVEVPDEARHMLVRLRREIVEVREARIAEETKKAREAEAMAQQRLEEFEAQQNVERPVHQLDVEAIKQEDAERQRRFVAQQAQREAPQKEWRLPLEGSDSKRQELIDRFKREIVYHGFSFVRSKYGATAAQVRHEAERLGLKIKWDVVRK